MEHINWPFQIISWIITVLLTPFLASLLAKNQMKKQLEKTYTNDRKSKINDLQIQNLSELHDTLSKWVTVNNHIRTAHYSFFTDVLKKKIEATDTTWYEHNLSILENDKTKINYLPQIKRKLLLVPNFKIDFENVHIETNGKKANYIEFDNYIKYSKPQDLFKKAKEGNLNINDINEYMSYSQLYYGLLHDLYSELESKIESIVKKETQFQY